MARKKKPTKPEKPPVDRFMQDVNDLIMRRGKYARPAVTVEDEDEDCPNGRQDEGGDE